MQRSTWVIPSSAFAPLMIYAAAGAGCGQSSQGFAGAPFDAGWAAPEASAPVEETLPNLVADVGVPSARGEVVSSLALEQVWFLTGAGSGFESMIDFRGGQRKVTCGLPVGQTEGFEGTAVFTEPATGELLFYADGITVFHGGTHQMLENGYPLTGDPSACEPALIAPMNGSGGKKFYVFTNSTNNNTDSEISYSIIDLMKGPSGAVVQKNVKLFRGNPGEGLDIVPHENGEDFWVLAYDTASKMQAFLVTSQGVSPISVHSDLGLGGHVMRGAINHSYDYKKLALGQNYGGPNGLVAVADFDRATGRASTAKTLATGDMGYHASFSANGSKVYYVRGSEGWEGVAYQYDLNSGKESVLGGSKLAASKLAPDGRLYFAGFGNDWLAIVEHPDEPASNAGFYEKGLYLEGCKAAYGVPNQTASYLNYLPPVPK